jgi:hypothetical protein
MVHIYSYSSMHIHFAPCLTIRPRVLIFSTRLHGCNRIVSPSFNSCRFAAIEMNENKMMGVTIVASLCGVGQWRCLATPFVLSRCRRAWRAPASLCKPERLHSAAYAISILPLIVFANAPEVIGSRWLRPAEGWCLWVPCLRPPRGPRGRQIP